jgi:hypothetical protein
MRAVAGTEGKKRMIGTGFNKPFSGKQDRLEGAHKPWSGPEGGKCRRPIGNDRVNDQNARARAVGMSYGEYTSMADEQDDGLLLDLKILERKLGQSDTEAAETIKRAVNQIRMQKLKLGRFEQKEEQKGGH